jgi:hypothetical protein
MNKLTLAVTLALVSVPALADVGGKEPGTYYGLDRDTTTYIEIDGLHLKQLHRSRFDKKDPNYYWLFDKAPCLYTEVWSAKYPCPVKKRGHYDDNHEHDHGGSKPVPEPGGLLLMGLGLGAFGFLNRRKK